MECPHCGAELTEITVIHNYSIVYDKEQGKWVKQVGEVIYSCGDCEVILDIHNIEDILKQVDEL